LTVTVQDKGSGNVVSKQIDGYKESRLSEEEIERKLEEEKEMMEKDKMEIDHVRSRQVIENMVFWVRDKMNDKENDLKENLSEDVGEKIEEVIRGMIVWLDENTDVEKEDYEEKTKELESVVRRFFKRVDLERLEMVLGVDGFGYFLTP